MEQVTFDSYKAEIRKKIEEAVQQGNAHRIHAYSRMAMDFEDAAMQDVPIADSRSQLVEFSVS